MRPMRAYKALLPALAILAACTDPSTQSKAQQPPAFTGGNVDLAQPTRRPPGDPLSMKSSFAPVVKKAAPAVVNVASRRVVRQRADPFWDFFMGGGGMPRDQVQQSLGSGAIVRSDGVIVTNHHVIEGMTEIAVQLSDRREFPATVLLDDARSDLAILKIDTKGEKLPVLAIDDQEPVQVGDLVLAIGNPFGVGQTVTNGIVSALARTDVGITDYSFFIQTDAAINPGNSGGPLVDMDGDLIGLNTAIFSRSGSSSGVGFAIPAAMVKQVVTAALGGKSTVVRPWLGAHGQSVTGEIARTLGMNAPRGDLIAEVWPGSAAARAGLKAGDVVLAVDGQPVNDDSGVTYYFATRKPGDAVQLTVWRDGREISLSVRAEPAPATPAREERTYSSQTPLQGATVVNVSPATAGELGIDPFAGQGVLITKVDRGFAMQAGLRPGDYVREINGKVIETVRDLTAALATPGGAWTVTIEREGQKITAQFRT
jgi:Do/DeqQ family serine protease